MRAEQPEDDFLPPYDAAVRSLPTEIADIQTLTQNNPQQQKNGAAEGCVAHSPARPLMISSNKTSSLPDRRPRSQSNRPLQLSERLTLRPALLDGRFHSSVVNEAASVMTRRFLTAAMRRVSVGLI
jgi:hypothetical protein